MAKEEMIETTAIGLVKSALIGVGVRLRRAERKGADRHVVYVLEAA